MLEVRPHEESREENCGLKNDRRENARTEEEKQKKQHRTVLLERPPDVLLLRRQQSVDDVRAVERRDRDQVEDSQDAVVEDDFLEDRPVRAVEQFRATEAKRNGAD